MSRKKENETEKKKNIPKCRFGCVRIVYITILSSSIGAHGMRTPDRILLFFLFFFYYNNFVLWQGVHEKRKFI